MPPPEPLVIAQAVEIHAESGGGVGADHEVQALAGPNGDRRGVAFDPRMAEGGVGIDPELVEAPIQRALLLVFLEDEGGPAWCGHGETINEMPEIRNSKLRGKRAARA